MTPIPPSLYPLIHLAFGHTGQLIKDVGRVDHDEATGTFTVYDHKDEVMLMGMGNGRPEIF